MKKPKRPGSRGEKATAQSRNVKIFPAAVAKAIRRGIHAVEAHEVRNSKVIPSPMPARRLSRPGAGFFDFQYSFSAEPKKTEPGLPAPFFPPLRFSGWRNESGRTGFHDPAPDSARRQSPPRSCPRLGSPPCFPWNRVCRQLPRRSSRSSCC